jgi:cbb3-type cytochrome oxidase subunit 3
MDQGMVQTYAVMALATSKSFTILIGVFLVAVLATIFGDSNKQGQA